MRAMMAASAALVITATLALATPAGAGQRTVPCQGIVGMPCVQRDVVTVETRRVKRRDVIGHKIVQKKVPIYSQPYYTERQVAVRRPAPLICAPPPPAPVYAPPRSTCNTCGVGPSASLPGKIDTCDNGQQTNRPRPTNGVWVPKVNPRSGQCTWWNAEGNAPIYR